MTEYVETVDEQRKRIAEEKADKNIVMHYFQRRRSTFQAY